MTTLLVVVFLAAHGLVHLAIWLPQPEPDPERPPPFEPAQGQRWLRTTLADRRDAWRTAASAGDARGITPNPTNARTVDRCRWSWSSTPVRRR